MRQRPVIPPPALAAGLLFARKGYRHLFLNPGIPDWLVVDGAGARVLGLCRGDRSADDIVAEVAGLGGEPAAVTGLLDRAACHGLFGPPAAPAAAAPVGGRPGCAAVSSGLATVHVALTNRCNLRCQSCHAESGRSAGMLSLTELTDLAGQVEAAAVSGGLHWVLSGGEPMLHPALLDFAHHLSVKGHSVALLTNGTLVNAGNAPVVARAFDLIKVSLDGSREDIHAGTRGTGNHIAVTRAIDLLLAAGANVEVATVVHRGNRDDLPVLAARYGGRLAVQPFIAAGRGAAAAGLALSGEEYHAALSAMPGFLPTAEIRRVVAAARGRGIRSCAAAGGEISVDETGEVYPCRLFHRPAYKAGNIRRQPVAEILASPVFRRLAGLTVDVLDGCGDCPIRLICGGACRARAFHESGRDDVAGGFCAYERLAYVDAILDGAEL